MSTSTHMEISNHKKIMIANHECCAYTEYFVDTVLFQGLFKTAGSIRDSLAMRDEAGAQGWTASDWNKLLVNMLSIMTS